ncbi:hypothetical protein, partial [Staphylococcus haemolyticus]|uniref:hypothetical protein n=1 Tax=Staphylococcus haemolyticus TaxID=1283 RepID=UPI001C5C9078
AKASHTPCPVLEIINMIGVVQNAATNEKIPNIKTPTLKVLLKPYASPILPPNNNSAPAATKY